MRVLAITRYAALDQINKDNFSSLKLAWRLKTDAFGPRPECNFEGTATGDYYGERWKLFRRAARVQVAVVVTR